MPGASLDRNLEQPVENLVAPTARPRYATQQP
jgi:hypothetical protein